MPSEAYPFILGRLHKMIEMKFVTVAGIYFCFSKIINFFGPPFTCTKRVGSFPEINIKNFNLEKCFKIPFNLQLTKT